MTWLAAAVGATAGVTVPPESTAFLRANCADCHADGADEGGFTLESLSGDLSEDDVDRWVRAIDRVTDGEMPPADHATLRSSQRLRFTKATGEAVARHQRVEAGAFGRVRGRKLTGQQLENSLHDLLGVDIPLAERLPDEPRTNGYTTVARGQSMSYFDLQNHLELVDAALDEAFRRVLAARSSGPRKETWSKKLSAEDLARNNPKSRNRQPEMYQGKAVVWRNQVTFYGQLSEVRAKEPGWYRLTVKASAMNAPPQGVWCSVRTGACRSSDPALRDVGVFLATKKPQEFSFEAFLEVGQTFEIRPADERTKKAFTPNGQVGAGECQKQNVAGVGMHSATLERFHKGPGDDFIRETLIGDTEIDWDSKAKQFYLNAARPEAKVGVLMRKFARRAFRRPVSNSDLREYLGAAKSQLKDGVPLAEVLRNGFRSILCSPRFVYLVESPGELDDHALAARLSYFLWNTTPDETLLSLADKGRLSDEKVLREQVGRMLEGDRARMFADAFTREWLELSEIDFTQPSRKLHPQFDPVLQMSMVEETQAFFAKLIAEDRSVANVVDSRFAMLNERLAGHYGIDGVSAGEVTEVSLPADSPRGGLITQGAVLKVTANGTDTSPVLRGVWISERLLGVHVPPPPTNVPAVEPDVRGATTIRDLLAKHRSDDACASCHVKVDPVGFALENFDAAGEWRSKYPKYNKRGKGPKVDASYQTGGVGFKDVVGFQKLITAQPDRLAKSLAEQLLTYGTGGPPEFADRPSLEKIVRQTKRSDYGVRSIIEAVVLSETFRTK